MNYKEIVDELKKLEDMDFDTQYIDKIMTIISKIRSYYIKMVNKNDINNQLYNEIALRINTLLKIKIKELDNSLTNANINDMISGIIGNHMFVKDIMKLEDYVFIEGRSSFDFNNKDILLSVNSSLRDIASSEFYDCKNNNYVNSLIGKNVINRLVEILNCKFGEYFNIDDNILSNIGNNVVYNTPVIKIQLNKTLDEICNGMINNDVYNIEVIVMYNGEAHLFDLNLGINAYNISEVDSNVWKLSEINNKKKVK